MYDTHAFRHLYGTVPRADRSEPNRRLRRDLSTIQLLDELGYDEAWIGEHHSCGVELIPAPEIFIAHAAAQTRYIKLGAGVISLPYHNPLWVADRMMLLDHPDAWPRDDGRRPRRTAHGRHDDWHRSARTARCPGRRLRGADAPAAQG